MAELNNVDIFDEEEEDFDLFEEDEEDEDEDWENNLYHTTARLLPDIDTNDLPNTINELKEAVEKIDYVESYSIGKAELTEYLNIGISLSLVIKDTHEVFPYFLEHKDPNKDIDMDIYERVDLLKKKIRNYRRNKKLYGTFEINKEIK